MTSLTKIFTPLSAENLSACARGGEIHCAELLDDIFYLVLFVELGLGCVRLLCRFPWRKTQALPDSEEYKTEKKNRTGKKKKKRKEI